MNQKKLEILERYSDQSQDEMKKVDERYPVLVPKFILERVEEGSYSKEALKQFMPDIRELSNYTGYSSDPTGEAGLHPEKLLLQTYDNRLAIFMTPLCLVYCRFCFRKEFVGKQENKTTETELEKAVEYIKSNTKIEDVLLSGGDPLAVSNRTLIPFLEKLVSIRHVKAIRIHSRAISVMPDRIDPELVSFLSRHNHFWYYAHLNHPDDIDHDEVKKSIKRLQSAGVPVLNQSVLLKGVNDNATTLRSLMLLCYYNRVIPYNLYVLDKINGGAHFDLSNDEISNLYASLSDLPGPAQPALVYVDQKSKKHRFVNSPNHEVFNFLKGRV